MKYKLKSFCFIIFFSTFSVFITGVQVYADDPGGQVTVPATVTFEQEETKKTENSKPKETESKEKLPSTSSSTQNKGLLPKTGEYIQNNFLYIGLFALIALTLLLFKRKRGEDDEVEKG